MLKVDKKPQRQDPEEKNDSETNQQQQKQEDAQKTRPRSRLREYDTYEIDHQTLPYIFRFNYAALQRLKIKRSPQVPQLAVDIFDYLKDKLVVRRYSEGGKHPNRMKYQQKVKFLMRAFDHRRPPPASTPNNASTASNSTENTPKQRQKFNRQKQLQFFTRPQVRQHFLAQIQHALVKKRAQNQRRIRDMQDCIEVALQFQATDPQKAQRVFQHRIKRKQLPWTDNMFEDIEEFSKQLYARFSPENVEIERQAIQTHNASKMQKKEESEDGSGEVEGGSFHEGSAQEGSAQDGSSALDEGQKLLKHES